MVDNEGFDPSTSRMLSVRSTNWASRPVTGFIRFRWWRHSQITVMHTVDTHSNTYARNDARTTHFHDGACWWNYFSSVHVFMLLQTVWYVFPVRGYGDTVVLFTRRHYNINFEIADAIKWDIPPWYRLVSESTVTSIIDIIHLTLHCDARGIEHYCMVGLSAIPVNMCSS